MATNSDLPKITQTELYEMLDAYTSNGTLCRHNIHLVGKAGIGKTKIIRDYFKTREQYKKFRFEPLYLAQMADPGDITGLPVADLEHNVMRFLPPWWHSETDPVVLFCDEILRASLPIIQPFFSLALDKQVVGRSLPKGSIVIGASNFGEEFQQTEADSAFGSRFTTFLFEPTPEEWIQFYAIPNKVDPRIVHYIRENPIELDGERTEEMHFLSRTPDRRAWSRVDNILKIHGQERLTLTTSKMIAGEIGIASAGLFTRFCESVKSISPEKMLNSLEFEEEVLMELQTMTMVDLISMADRALDYIKSRDADLKVGDENSQMLKVLFATNIRKFLQFCQDNEMSEVVGKVITKVKKLPEAKFVWASDKKLQKLAEDYIDSLNP
jgi:hypothetical protein